MSFASWSTTSVAQPVRTHIPYQIGKSNPATPASAIVGTSGSKVERRAVLTPNATSVPLRMWGRAREIGTESYVKRAAIALAIVSAFESLGEGGTCSALIAAA